MKRYLIAGALLLAIPACDKASDPGPRISDVTLTPDTRTIQVGETLQLTATAQNDDGSAASGTISWSSLEPQVADVTQSGMVTGRSSGAARIVASLGGFADTSTITVTAASDCATSGERITLAVGESRQATGAAAGTLCVEGTAAGAEFVMVPHHQTDSNTSLLSLSITGSGITAAAGLNPSVLPQGAPRLSRSGAPARHGLERDLDFHVNLRRRAHAELDAHVPYAQSVYGRRASRPGPRYQVSAAVPAVGSTMSINVSQQACTNADNRTGRVVAVSEKAIVVADVNNPSGGLTDAEYRHLGTTFDTLVHPVDIANFGEPTDIDQNGRSIIFYTRAVNELTPSGNGGYVAGFFYSRDLFPKTNQPGFTGCPGSNAGEVFYMLVPDPNGEVNGNRRSRDLILDSTVGTLAHEYQHLINASRRLYVLDTQNWDEDVWLNEALSHIAEELLFYRVGQIGPRQNINIETIRATEGRRFAFNNYASDNFGRYDDYLRAPTQNSPYDGTDGGDDLATRGAAWSYLRYVADRRNGNDQALWLSLVNSTRLGFANLQNAIGTDPRPWLQDWTTSVYTDDAVPTEERLQQPSWNTRDLFAAFYATNTGPGRLPLATITLANGAQTNVALIAGAGAFVKFGVAPGGVGTVRTTSGGGTPPSNLAVTLVRIR